MAYVRTQSSLQLRTRASAHHISAGAKGLHPPGAFGNIVQRKASFGEVAQRKGSHVRAYIREHGLNNIVVSQKSIQAYVNNPENPLVHRRGLMKAWNTGLNNHKVVPAEDMEYVTPPESTGNDNFLDWDSDDETNWDVGESIKKFKTPQEVNVFRKTKKTTKKGVVLPMDKLTKICRQVVKRKEIKNLEDGPVLIGNVDGFYMEIAFPRKNDFVAIPLVQSTNENTFLREGQAKDWGDIAKSLDAESKDDGEDARPRKKRRLLNYIEGTHGVKTPSEAEAVGAMLCDFMKGSGAGTYVENLYDQDDKVTFQEFFSGKEPIYLPSSPGGRKLAKKATRERKEERKRKRENKS